MRNLALWFVVAFTVIAACDSSIAHADTAPPFATLGFAVKAVGSELLAVTTTSARQILAQPAQPQILVTNKGVNPACVKLGDATVVASLPCPAGRLAGPGQTLTLGMGAATYIAAIATAGTTSLALLEGYLTPALAP